MLNIRDIENCKIISELELKQLDFFRKGTLFII